MGLALMQGFRTVRPRHSEALVALFLNDIFPGGGCDDLIPALFTNMLHLTGTPHMWPPSGAAAPHSVSASPALYRLCDGLPGFWSELALALAVGPLSGHEAASELLQFYWVESDARLPKLWEKVAGTEHLVGAVSAMLGSQRLIVNQRGFQLLSTVMDWTAAVAPENRVDVGLLALAITAWLDGALTRASDRMKVTDEAGGADVVQHSSLRASLLLDHCLPWLQKALTLLPAVISDALSPSPPPHLQRGSIWRPLLDPANPQYADNADSVLRQMRLTVLTRIWVLSRLLSDDPAFMKLLDALLPLWMDHLCMPGAFRMGSPDFWRSVVYDVMPPFAGKPDDSVLMIVGQLFMINSQWRDRGKKATPPTITPCGVIDTPLGHPGSDPRGGQGKSTSWRPKLQAPLPRSFAALLDSKCPLTAAVRQTPSGEYFPRFDPPPPGWQATPEIHLTEKKDAATGEMHMVPVDVPDGLQFAFHGIQYLRLLSQSGVVLPLELISGLMHPAYPIGFANALLDCLDRQIAAHEQSWKAIHSDTPPTPLYTLQSLSPLLAVLSAMYPDANERIAGRPLLRPQYLRFLELSTRLLGYVCGLNLPITPINNGTDHLLVRGTGVFGEMVLPSVEQQVNVILLGSTPSEPVATDAIAVRLTPKTPFVNRIIHMLHMAAEQRETSPFDETVVPSIALAWLHAVLCAPPRPGSPMKLIDLPAFLEEMIPFIMTSLWTLLDNKYGRASLLAYSLVLACVHSPIGAGGKALNPSTPSSTASGSHFFCAASRLAFETGSWMTRYEAVECAFGLLSKLDPAMGEQPVPCFGLVLAYLVRSLTDTEEYVRTKALTLLQSLEPVQTYVAVRCLAVNLLDASVEGKLVVLRKLQLINQVFPEHLVLPWTDILSILRSTSPVDAEPTPEWTSYQAATAALALQLIAHDVTGTADHAIPVLESLRSLIRQHDHESLLMKTFVDGATQLLDRNHSIAPQLMPLVLEIVHKELSSGKFTQWMLKGWLELLHVVVFKYPIQTEDAHYTILVDTIRIVLSLVTSSHVNEDNKLFSVIVCQAMTEQAPRTGVVLLSEMMRVLFRLCIKSDWLAEGASQDSRLPSPVVVKAQRFLQSIFQQFRGTGLFVLLFRLDISPRAEKAAKVDKDREEEIDWAIEESEEGWGATEMQFFDLLKRLLEGGEKDFGLDLADPLWDVCYHMFGTPMTPAEMTTVMRNVCHFLSRVYNKPINASLLVECGVFMDAFIKFFPPGYSMTYAVDFCHLLLVQNGIKFKVCSKPAGRLFRRALHEGAVNGRAVRDYCLAHAEYLWQLTGTEKHTFSKQVAECTALVFRRLGRATDTPDATASLALSYALMLLEETEMHDADQSEKKVVVGTSARVTHTRVLGLSVVALAPSVVKNADRRLHMHVTEHSSTYWAVLVDHLARSQDTAATMPLKQATARYVVRQCRLEPRHWRSLLEREAATGPAPLGIVVDPRPFERHCRLLSHLLMQLVVMDDSFGLSTLAPLVGTVDSGEALSPVRELVRPAVATMHLASNHAPSKAMLEALKRSFTVVKCLVFYLEHGGSAVHETTRCSLLMWSDVWGALFALLIDEDGEAVIGGQGRDVMWGMVLDMVLFVQAVRPHALAFLEPQWLAATEAMEARLNELSNASGVAALKALVARVRANARVPLPGMRDVDVIREIMVDLCTSAGDVLR